MDTYHYWTVRKYFRKKMKRGAADYAECMCACGKVSNVAVYALKHGKSKSCGCKNSPGYVTHGLTRGPKIPPEYSSWQHMKRRCYSPTHTRYESWGGRGITVCDRWKNNFPAFLDDMGPKPTPGHSIERRDNNGPYSPENCFWASPIEQSRNTRRNRMLTLNGVSKSLVEWSEQTGLSRTVITQRIDGYGWSVEKTLTTPVRCRK